MKTTIKSLASVAIIALSLAANITVSNAKNQIVNNKKVISYHPNQINVRGDIEVLIVQTTKGKPRYENNGSADVTIKQVGNRLYISPKKGEAGARITLYINELYRIDAAEGAVVKTSNKLAVPCLQIFLKDTAQAEVEATTNSLYTVIKDRADLVLKGSTAAHVLAMDKLCSVKMESFVADKTEFNNTANAIELAATR